MTPKDNSGNGGRPLAAEVAIIGAGPVGLMTANLLGLAGIRVLVLERNAGLLGLPRAIAYDAETLRLFSQVGLFDEISPGLIQDPHVRHLNARNVTLMAADFPRGLYGHSSLGTFFQPDFERVLLEGPRAIPVGPGRLRARSDRPHSEREGRHARGQNAIGRDHGRSGLCRRLRRRRESHAGAPRRQARRLDLFGTLAGGRRDRQESRRQADHFHLRSAPAPGRAARGRRAGAVGVHATAWRKRRDAEARRDDPRPRRGGSRRPFVRDRAQGRLYIPCARRRTLAARPRVPRRRRGASDAALRRAGHERGHEGRVEPGLEAGRRPSRPRAGRNPRHLRGRAGPGRAQNGGSLASARRRHHADQPDRRRGARLPLRLSQPFEPVPSLHRPRRRRAAAGDPSQRLDEPRSGPGRRADGAAAEGVGGAGRFAPRSLPWLPSMARLGRRS